MAVLTKGYAGSGKTKQLLEDVYKLVDTSGSSPENFLILTLTNTEKDLLIGLNRQISGSKNINVWSFDNLINYLLKKSPSTVQFKTISDFLAINLIGSICKKEFQKNSALLNLTKSNTFFRELYNLFGLFKNSEIDVENLYAILEKSSISAVDKQRLGVIFNVFDLYNKTLKVNNYLDYRDMVLQALKNLNSNELLLNTIKSKFGYVFVDGLEDITYLQFKLLKIVANPDCLYFYGDEYSRVQEFRGAWKDSLIVETLKSEFKTLDTIELKDSKRNNEILKRAVYLVQKYNGKASGDDFLKVDDVKYKQFEDLQSEILYISQDILKKVKSGNCDFSDCAILIRDYEAKQKIIDLFKSQGIPINSELYNQDYQNLRVKLSRYLSISEVLEKLGITAFDGNNIAKVSVKSKAEKEILFEELDLYTENILSEVLEDFYVKERFVSIQSETKSLSLLSVIYKNLGLLKDSDRQNLLDEFEKISEVYKLFKAQKFSDLILFVVKDEKDAIKNPQFNSIFAKLFTKISEIAELYQNILKEKIDLQVVKDVLNLSFEDSLKLSNSVNLLTFFKTAGLEFKHVYIPSLTENAFPKPVKATYFISSESNEIISSAIREISPNFRHLIESDKESIEEEARLFYLGMTRAKESLTISTYNWAEKKQIQPSVFFELLAKKDCGNYEAVSKTIVEDEEEFTLEENTFADAQKEVVVKDKLTLNPSAITNFLSCPKKYYCKNLLNLGEESVFAASYGTIVHAILELFVKKHLGNYTKETILDLGKILFDSKIELKKAMDTGFKQLDIDKVIATDDLSLEEMKENFSEAVDDLERKGFFEKIPEEALTEQKFKFQTEEFPNVEFNGRIDAILKFDNGYKIIDYKTGKTKKPDLTKMVNNSTNSEKEKALQKYEYQIPIYYLASKNAEELKDYKDKISELGLFYVRPNSAEEGCHKDFVTAGEIEEQKSKILENLKNTVVDRILEKDCFEPKENYKKCEKCSYKLLCDKSEADESDD